VKPVKTERHGLEQVFQTGNSNSNQTFVGNQEVGGIPMPNISYSPTTHPLYEVFMDAIEQATKGKGVRHGGDVTPFMSQPWTHYAKMHGDGFLTGQAAKKLEEAASNRGLLLSQNGNGNAYERELLGAIVYIGMAVLSNRSKGEL
jgi:hypothetical protein